jgi:penicillin-binding protein 1A
MPDLETPKTPSSKQAKLGRSWLNFALKAVAGLVGLGVAVAVAGAMVIATALAVAYPNLPDISDLSDYRPKLPLRVFSADGALLGEFGEERRNLTPLKDIPRVMINALLAIEDADFYEHSGISYRAFARAALANLKSAKSQGGSTITMQVAKNVYLSSDKNYMRKIYEILLTFKLEHMLTKDQILEIYMNQIFLGNRAYGFSAASDAYFGKPLKDVTVAQAAMLAGLPKAPSAFNPLVNPTRARVRQQYIIERMLDNSFITAEQAAAAKVEDIKLKTTPDITRVHAEYVAETVRQLIYSQYGEDAYTRGLNVYTTLRSAEQQAAYRALRKGIMDFERRQPYRGPEKFFDIPTDPREAEEAVDEALTEFPDNDDIKAAVVMQANARKVTALRQNGEVVEVAGDGLRAAQSGLSDKAAPTIKIRRGAIIRVSKNAKGTWDMTQLPEVEGAFIALDPRDGSVRALVGGFDYAKNKFNHVTQAWRQPGSSFKPFVYSAALEKGLSPATVINDSPLFFDAGVTGGQPWEPKNYDGTFDGPMSMRRGLAKSKNMVSIRILQSVGAKETQDWVTNFGFDAERHPPYLTMALGAGSVTPMQMATAYSVFANGGYRVNPWMVAKITDQKGKVLLDFTPPLRNESTRGIDARNAFVMSSLLQEVTRSGTAASASKLLKRSDIYGKTGTTNDSIDAWFAGYQHTVAAVTWIGYDTPRKLGDRESGGGLSLPVWITYMETALKGVPAVEPRVPEGVINIGGEWYYEEYGFGAGVRSLGLEDRPAATPPTEGAPDQQPSAPEEKKSILDLFKG